MFTPRTSPGAASQRFAPFGVFAGLAVGAAFVVAFATSTAPLAAAATPKASPTSKATKATSKASATKAPGTTKRKTTTTKKPARSVVDRTTIARPASVVTLATIVNLVTTVPVTITPAPLPEGPTTPDPSATLVPTATTVGPTTVTTIPPTSIVPLLTPPPVPGAAAVAAVLPARSVNICPAATTTVAPTSTSLPAAIPAGGAVPIALPEATTTIAPSIRAPRPPLAGPLPPPIRATATGIDPYRGTGAWIDRFDWSVVYSRRTNPPIGVAQIDAMAAAGVQTVYVQAAQWNDPNDIIEVDRLRSLIDRAHANGMLVVGWYLPDLTDINDDLWRAQAISQLDVDGIAFDMETTRRFDVCTTEVKNRRQLEFSTQARAALPGRAIGAIVLAPTWTETLPNSLWPFFPYFEQTGQGTHDVWVVMGYWTDMRNRFSTGWYEPYRYTLENVNRLRTRLGRADLPIHIVGGVMSNVRPGEVEQFARAARETGVIGASLYDWASGSPAMMPPLWPLRFTPPGQAPDPRFPA